MNEKDINSLCLELSAKVEEKLRGLKNKLPNLKDNSNLYLSLMVYIKSYRYFKAIICLCDNGHIEEAIILLRCFYESTICLMLFEKDEKNIDRWCKHFGYMLGRESLKNKSISEEDKNKYTQDYDVFKNMFVHKDSKGKEYIDSYWYPGGLKAAAINVGMEIDYETCFIFPSDFIHTTLLSIKSYIQQKAEDTILLLLKNPNSQAIPYILFYSLKLMITCNKSIKKEIELLNDDSIMEWEVVLTKQKQKLNL